MGPFFSVVQVSGTNSYRLVLREFHGPQSVGLWEPTALWRTRDQMPTQVLLAGLIIPNPNDRASIADSIASFLAGSPIKK